MLPWKGFTKSSFPVCHNYHCPNSHSRWNHCNNQFANLLAYVITYQSATGQPAGHVVIANGKMQIQLYHPPVWGFLCFPVTDGTIREVCESKSTISRALQHLAHTAFQHLSCHLPLWNLCSYNTELLSSPLTISATSNHSLQSIFTYHLIRSHLKWAKQTFTFLILPMMKLRVVKRSVQSFTKSLDKSLPPYPGILSLRHFVRPHATPHTKHRH